MKDHIDKKPRLVIFGEKSDKDKKELLLQMISQAQAADVAKTRIRQALKENNQERVERFICPEIYTESPDGCQEHVPPVNRNGYQKNNGKNFIGYWISTIASVVAICGFIYMVYENNYKDQRVLDQDITVLKEVCKKNSDTISKIEDMFVEMQKDVKNNTLKLGNLEVRLSIIEQQIKDQNKNGKL